VAELVPLPRRSSSVTWEEFMEGSESWKADSQLTQDLADLIPDATDDVPFE